VPNLLIGQDFKNDTINQGSDDARAPNLPIGLDHDDEDGDNKIYSPSVCLEMLNMRVVRMKKMMLEMLNMKKMKEMLNRP
jgi:hypothetical protein